MTTLVVSDISEGRFQMLRTVPTYNTDSYKVNEHQPEFSRFPSIDHLDLHWSKYDLGNCYLIIDPHRDDVLLTTCHSLA